MLRQSHAIPGLVSALLIIVLAITGAVLALDPLIERAKATQPARDMISVAALAARVATHHKHAERITRSASGTILVHYRSGTEGMVGRVDHATGRSVIAPPASATFQFITNLHRSLLLGGVGRMTAGIGSAFLLVLSLSGMAVLARRLGGWRAFLRPINGPPLQRVHSEISRIAVLGLLLSSLSGCYMSLATFGVVPDASPAEMEAARSEGGGKRIAINTIGPLRAIDINDLRELTYPKADDASDTFEVTTSLGAGRIDPFSGKQLTFEPHSVGRQVYEVFYMLHTGQGLWPVAILTGLSALAAPFLAVTGIIIWWRRMRSSPRIPSNSSARRAETILLVGSEGGATWQFAATLHAALVKSGQRVHAAPMNALRSNYPSAKRLIILTSTYGDGGAPTSARHFLKRVKSCRLSVPVAVLGFGDRSYPKFCAFAHEVVEAASARGWSHLVAPTQIDRQSIGDFAQWGAAVGAAIGSDLRLDHAIRLPSLVKLSLIESSDYGEAVGAPTAILRFAATSKGAAPRLPHFEAGDLVGIVPPGSPLPRFYSLASSSRDGILEICVRKQEGGLCSGFLHNLRIGEQVSAYIKPNYNFRPSRGRGPLILIGAGAGIGPLMGFVRHNRRRRPIHLYWGGRDPRSDFLYEGDLSYYLDDKRLSRLRTAFSRVSTGGYVQDRLTVEANVIRDLIQRDAQILICGGREMANSVAIAIDVIVKPLGLDLKTLKERGRYIEDVY